METSFVVYWLIPDSENPFSWNSWTQPLTSNSNLSLKEWAARTKYARQWYSHQVLWYSHQISWYSHQGVAIIRKTKPIKRWGKKFGREREYEGVLESVAARSPEGDGIEKKKTQCIRLLDRACLKWVPRNATWDTNSAGDNPRWHHVPCDLDLTTLGEQFGHPFNVVCDKSEKISEASRAISTHFQQRKTSRYRIIASLSIQWTKGDGYRHSKGRLFVG